MPEPERDPAEAHRADLPVDPDVTPADRTAAEVRTRAGAAGPYPPRVSGPPRQAIRPSLPYRPRGRARVAYLWRRTRRVLVSRGDILVVIAAGGAVGSLARWGLAQALPRPADAFPWATFEANVSGCFALGVLMVFLAEVWPPSRYLRPLLGVGVLGGYTTFSTYLLDTRSLLLSGRTGLAGAYVAASLASGLAAVWVGIVAVRALVVLARRRAERRLRRTEDDDRAPAPAPAPGPSPRAVSSAGPAAGPAAVSAGPAAGPAAVSAGPAAGPAAVSAGQSSRAGRDHHDPSPPNPSHPNHSHSTAPSMTRSPR
jgi:CrcB protein